MLLLSLLMSNTNSLVYLMCLKQNLVSLQQWEVNHLSVRLIFWISLFLFHSFLFASTSAIFSLQQRNHVSLPFNLLTLYSGIFLLNSSNCVLMSVFFHSGTLYNKVHQINHWPNNLPTNQVALKFELIDFNVFSALCVFDLSYSIEQGKSLDLRC